MGGSTVPLGTEKCSVETKGRRSFDCCCSSSVVVAEQLNESTFRKTYTANADIRMFSTFGCVKQIR